MSFQDADQFIEDVQKLTGRCTFSHSDSPSLSDQERQTMAIVLALRARLECDLLGCTLRASDWRRSILALRELSIDQYFRDWKEVERQVMATIGDPTVPVLSGETFPDFKRRVSRNVHYKWIVTSLEPFSRVEGEVNRVAALRQWLTFDSRLLLPSVDNTGVLTAEYLGDEARLASLTYDVQYERMVVEEWFGAEDPCLSPMSFRHGPGATHETRRADGIAAKYHYLAADQQLATYVQEHLYYDIEDVFYTSSTGAEERTCDIVFVPKSALTKRLISKEPVPLQWVQQHLKNFFVDVFEKTETLRVNLFDTSVSRDLAQIGSYFGNYATVDLSKASDSVTLRLVSDLFGNCPVFPGLLASRSTHVRIGQETITMAKFAPMGSALCFPVECVVFASICEAAIRRVAGRRSRNGEYAVYGDDIVIASEYVDEVLQRLEQLHFIVNTDKSFSHPGSRFREACGIEAYKGIDVTPLRVGRGMKGFPFITRDPEGRYATTIDSGTLACMCDLINRTYERGYREVRKCLLAIVQSSTVGPYVYRIDAYDVARHGSPCSPYIIVDDMTATNYRCRHRYNKSLYRAEVRCLAVTTKVPNSDQAELGLFHWYHSATRRSFSQHKGACAEPQEEAQDGCFLRRPSTELRWKWVQEFT